jgi:hypothetical protein
MAYAGTLFVYNQKQGTLSLAFGCTLSGSLLFSSMLFFPFFFFARRKGLHVKQCQNASLPQVSVYTCVLFQMIPCTFVIDTRT